MTIIPLRRPAGNHLDALPALWNTSSSNPDVKARQQRAAERTAFRVEHSPGYAAELARLQDWIGSYEIPTKEDA